MSVIEELRKVGAAMPEGSPVSVITGHVYAAENQKELLPSETVIVVLSVDGNQYSFIVKDHEWAQGTVADEIIAHMRQLLDQLGGQQHVD